MTMAMQCHTNSLDSSFHVLILHNSQRIYIAPIQDQVHNRCCLLDMPLWPRRKTPKRDDWKMPRRRCEAQSDANGEGS